MDIKNATGGKPNKKVQDLFLHFEKIWQPCNRLEPVRIPLSAVEWFDMRFNRSLHAWYYVRQGRQHFFKVQKKEIVLVFGFLPVAILISNRFQCVICQMKENKFLIYF